MELLRMVYRRAKLPSITHALKKPLQPAHQTRLKSLQGFEACRQNRHKSTVAGVSLPSSSNQSRVHDIQEDMDWTYDKLNATSRSFATVIHELPSELRDVVALFYLVLRALDTIEDDMTVDPKRKQVELANFYTHLGEAKWSLSGFGDKPEETELLAGFHKIIKCLEYVDPKYLKIIASICQQMGRGMAIFVNRPIESAYDWEAYCHYVAGLVGHGLSAIWSASGLENSNFTSEKSKLTSSSFGIFLQKTNIIRDVREDVIAGRGFWPKNVWREYVESQADLLNPKSKVDSLKCLNRLVTDALGHAEDCLDYLKDIRDPGIFRFCAIPQIMATATLSRCYGNYSVFQENVKIPRSEAEILQKSTSSLSPLLELTAMYCQSILDRIQRNDPTAELTAYRVNRLLVGCRVIKDI